MTGRSRAAAICAAATLLVGVVLVDGVGARGGRGGGMRGGGGGFGRGGGFNRGGVANRGSFGQDRPADRFDRGEYEARGPAADGDFDMEQHDFGDRQEMREERREERHDRREERREDGEDYADDYYDDDGVYYGGYYDEGYEEGVLWTLPCSPNLIALEGTIYYVCGTTWYIRAYSNGDVVYSEVPSPTGH